MAQQNSKSNTPRPAPVPPAPAPPQADTPGAQDQVKKPEEPKSTATPLEQLQAQIQGGNMQDTPSNEAQPDQQTDSSQVSDIPPDIRNFLVGLLTDAGMADMDEQVKEEMMTQLFERLDTYLAGVLVDKLPPEKMEEFIDMNNTEATPEQIDAFLKQNIPNAQEEFARAFAEFRNMYVNTVTIQKEKQV
jgi:hypothetical protein